MQFLREKLIIGDDNLNKLHKANILIFGLGGVGGYTLEALARAGIGNFTIVDNDKIDITNINRQIIANLNNLGNLKTEEFKKRILSINENAKVEIVNEFITEDNINIFDFKKYDYIVDAIDTIKTKILIAKRAWDNGIKVISAMGAGNKMHPELIEIEDIYKTSYDPIAKVMRKELKALGVKKLKVAYSKEEPIPLKEEIYNENKKKVIGSISFTPSAMGLLIASQVINDLLDM